jgi:NAD(P)-dependent dehydrogenase (short-subunit alcohol dehydrogenase family)/acyl carrier protein
MDAPNRQSIENLLLETVGRLTGYPVEMLGLDMNIEADLGIDSIKRVEILSSLEEEIPNLPTLSPEIMGEIKTLGQIVEVLSNTPTSATPQHETKSAYADNTGFCRNEIEVMPDASTSAQTDVSAVEFSSHVERRVVSLVKQPLEKNNRLSLAENRKVFITDDNTDLSDAIARQLNSMNIETAILSSDRSLVTRMAAEDVEKAAGLIIISNSDSHNTGFLKDAFLLTNRMASGLLQSGSEGGALFATITRLDGAFGFKNRGLVNPMQGGLAGLSKTAAREWENVSCHALDISPDWKDNDRIAATVVDELLYAENSGPNEIGLDADTRWTLALEPACYPQGTIDISQEDVIVVTGGARGVTASTVVALAKQTRPTFALLGRSPYPTPEPEWLAPLENEGTIKKGILEHDFNGQKASPLELEKAYKAYMANREITNNLNKITQTSANVHYYDVDIRDAGQVKQVLDDVRSSCGAIKGIVHGAGLLEDRWIVDKTLEQFETVFDTKVKGLCGLLEATQQDHLKYLVLFSSVAARFGNNGQVDYAMANEVLNKMAQQESITRPHCKVLSINWGPWDGGMVCAALKKKFNDNGVSLIPIDAGARCMLNEMMGDKNQPVEVVIGANVVAGKKKSGVQNIFKSPAQRAPTREKDAPSLTVQQRLAM